jgi:lysophospholipase L1-like esterase
VLAHLWGGWSSAENRGLVLVDGVHPTARGYTLMARALAPVIAQLARHELRRPSA